MPTMIKWSHPEWQSTLILNPEDQAMEIIKSLNPDEFDMSLLASQEVEMTQEEFDNLREWEG